ncbi:O-antigen ligase family protein [Paenibacillus sp. Soil787]|uniref:O-antigen ligase family protein n=1 Tax=Paenibacillus sp. Soil787 TaxID=1736411 RepID=UPI0006FFC63B|nr:O-antigen ligase family protein [Paenibacillus sp. Soil787]KRF35864.1 hypothetical protein ASG93_25615 [Paenibacillus sp. Soil787]
MERILDSKFYTYLLLSIVSLLIGILSTQFNVMFLVGILVLTLVITLPFSWKYSLYVFLFAASCNLFKINMFGLNARVDMIASIFCIIALIQHIFRRYDKKLPRLNLPIIIMILYLLYALVISIKTPVFKSDSLAGIFQLAFAFMGFVFIYLISYVDPARIYKYIHVYIGVCIIQTIYALASYFYYSSTGIFLFGKKYGALHTGQWQTSISLRGGLFEPNLFSIYAGCVLLLLITLFVAKIKDKPFFLTSIPVMILLLVGITLGWTRSVWIGIVLCLSIIIFVYKLRLFSPRNVIILFLITGAFLLIFPYLSSSFDQLSGTDGMFSMKLDTLFDSDSGTGSYRVHNLELALYDWGKDPIWGRGYFSIKAAGMDTIPWILNTFVAILHDTGIIGLTMIVILMLHVLLKGFAAIWRCKDQKHKAYLTGMVAGMVLSIFAYNFTPGHTLAMCWVHIGFVYVLAKMVPSEKKALEAPSN